MENLVVWQDSGMPTVSEINAKCQDSGHSVEFDSTIEMFNHTGYLPAKLDGHETGFEFYYLSKDSPDLIELDPYFKDSQGVMSVTRGDFRENLVALIFLQAVSQLTDGAYLGLSFDIAKNSADTPGYLQSEIEGMRVEVEREERKAAERLERQKARSETEGPPPLHSEQKAAPKSKGSFWSRLFGLDQ
ncbi:hypothetical protein [uncultured Erythrobacter sp.]|uniref:hypothetical protein n=1 Tax=uncultured Erythrobacter sp. TaxID=263913 RepID=UPI00261D8941|nr:hypothetical protein [uncultured Erythrobacter sp.]